MTALAQQHKLLEELQTMSPILSALGRFLSSQVGAEVAIGLIVSALSAGIAAAYRNYIPGLADLSDWITLRFRPHTFAAHEASPTLRSIQQALIRGIVRDQSHTGLHMGEFGRTSPPQVHGQFQAVNDRIVQDEDFLDVKPRMYLTFWPAMVLHNHRLAPRSVAMAIRGVRRLLRHDFRILVPQASVEGGPPGLQPRVTSYRHTMCGALLLTLIQGWNRASASVLGAMLEQPGGWQNDDNGWKQDTVNVASDIWASAYAAKLLATALGESDSSREQKDLAHAALVRTLEYFRRKWEDSGWAHGKVIVEENVVLIFIEMAPTLAKFAPTLHEAVREKLLSWLNAAHELRGEYLATIDKIRPALSPGTAAARMSFALFRAGCARCVWEPTFRYAAKTIDRTLNSAEAAFLLELAYVLDGGEPSNAGY